MSIFKKPVVGHVQGRYARAEDGSLRDQIVDGEGTPEDPETQIEPPKPEKPPGGMKKRLTNWLYFMLRELVITAELCCSFCKDSSLIPASPQMSITPKIR